VNQSLKNANVSTNVASKEHNKGNKKNESKSFKEEVNKFLVHLLEITPEV